MITLSYKKEVKAKKQHKCNFCNGVIMVGEKYYTSTHIYDNHIYDFKTHKQCSYIASRTNMYEYCGDEGLTMDDFMENIHEIYHTLLGEQIPTELKGQFKEISEELHNVRFENKLEYVIHHYRKKDKEKEILLEEKKIKSKKL